MALSQKQLLLIQNRLSEMGWKPICPVCQTNDWEIDGIFLVPSLGAKAEVDLENSMPQVHFVCNQCSYIMAFSAVKLGLLG